MYFRCRVQQAEFLDVFGCNLFLAHHYEFYKVIRCEYMLSNLFSY